MGLPPAKTIINAISYYSFFAHRLQDETSEFSTLKKLIYFSVKKAIFAQIRSFRIVYTLGINCVLLRMSHDAY
jgi:hypothetical protein